MTSDDEVSKHGAKDIARPDSTKGKFGFAFDGFWNCW